MTLDIKIPLVHFEYTKETTLISNLKGFMIINGEQYILNSVNYENDEYVITYHIYNNGNVKELVFRTSTLTQGETKDL